MIGKQEYQVLAALVARARIAEESGIPWNSKVWEQWLIKKFFELNNKLDPDRFSFQVNEYVQSFREKQKV